MDRKEFMSVLIAHTKMFATCRFDFSDPMVVNVWYDSLKEFSRPQLMDSLRYYLETADFFPSLAKIRQKLIAKPSSVDAAEDAVAKILAAIGKFGWPHADEAEHELGSFIWSIVKAYGGWPLLCDVTDEDLTNARAQLGRIAKQKFNYQEMQVSGDYLYKLEQSKEGSQEIKHAALRLALGGK